MKEKQKKPRRIGDFLDADTAAKIGERVSNSPISDGLAIMLEKHDDGTAGSYTTQGIVKAELAYKEWTLARGPKAKAARTAMLEQLHFPDWRRIAKGRWDEQRDRRRAGEAVNLDTYDEMARHIRDGCFDKPPPSLTIIKRAIQSMRPTLSGRRRRNAASKNRSD